ncbi:MAG: hypothetical protein J3R72DRAFT_499740 [Linnemannia gamsii]|nr:MAG: hypothetical protein J3R72DRAFT_499740 [Linnemannia gamsii]
MLRLMQEQMQRQQHLLQQQQTRIQKLEASNNEQDGKVVYKNLEQPFSSSTLNSLRHTLPSVRPSSSTRSFPRTTRFSSATTSSTLTDIWRTRPDSTTHSLTRSSTQEKVARHSENRYSVPSTVRISASHDASRISRMREVLYLDELGIKHGNDKEERLFTLDELASKKANADLVRKTYKKYELPKDKTKKPDKTSKDRSGANDKSKDQKSDKPHSKDKSGYKSDSNKSGYKSEGGKLGADLDLHHSYQTAKKSEGMTPGRIIDLVNIVNAFIQTNRASKLPRGGNRVSRVQQSHLDWLMENMDEFTGHPVEWLANQLNGLFQIQPPLSQRTVDRAINKLTTYTLKLMGAESERYNDPERIEGR